MLKKRALELSLIALVSAAYGCEDDPDETETSGEEAEHGEHAKQGDSKKPTSGSASAGKTGSAGAAAKAGAGGAGAKPAAGSGGSKSAAGSKAAASNDDAGPGNEPTSAFALTSDAFKDGDKLPKKYRCEAAVGGPTGPNPALAWSGAPASTKSFALLLRDRTFMNYQHWTIYDIPAETTKLPEGVAVGAETEPQPAKQANNSPGLTGPGFYGPCGQSGVNMYEFVLYALDVEALPDAGTTGMSVESALADHVLGMTSLKIVSGPE